MRQCYALCASGSTSRHGRAAWRCACESRPGRPSSRADRRPGRAHSGCQQSWLSALHASRRTSMCSAPWARPRLLRRGPGPKRPGDRMTNSSRLSDCGVVSGDTRLAISLRPKGIRETLRSVVRDLVVIFVSVFVAFSPAQKKAMGACGVAIDPHNVAFGVDPKGLGEGSTGDVDRGERALAQQKTMQAGGVRVVPHDVAFGVDPKGLGEGSTGDIDGGERTIAQ